MTHEILEAPITAKEIHDQISKLKNKKACGCVTDIILNEMIKHRRYYFGIGWLVGLAWLLAWLVGWLLGWTCLLACIPCMNRQKVHPITVLWPEQSSSSQVPLQSLIRATRNPS